MSSPPTASTFATVESRMSPQVAKNETDEKAPHEEPSVLGMGTSFDGVYRSEGPVRVRGVAAGEIESADTVYIEAEARVTANVTARQIVVFGAVDGELHCSGQLRVMASAHVTGSISAPIVIIEDGARFEGVLNMKTTMLAPTTLEPVSNAPKSVSAVSATFGRFSPVL